MSNLVHAGEFNTRIELFKNTFEETTTSERKRVEVSLGVTFAKRIEASSSTDEDGKVIPIYSRKYQVRFRRDLLLEGNEYFLKDIDGEYVISNVTIIDTRNRYLELKCNRRGD